MFLQTRRCSKLFLLSLFVVQLLISEVLGKNFAVHNKSPLDLYVATYYTKLLSARPIERYSEVVFIPANQTKKVDLPPMVWDIRTSRELVVSVNQQDLTESISAEKAKLLRSLDIGKTPSSSFYLFLEKGHIRIYDAIDWVVVRPVKKAYRSVKKIFFDELLMKQYRRIFANTDYSQKQAKMRVSVDIPHEEKRIIAQRFGLVKSASEKLVGQKLKDHEVPRIAICGSGGGYRAMIATLGSLLGAESIGVLDSTLYMSALSGSTWMLAPWLMHNMSLREYKEQLRARVNRAFTKNFFANPQLLTNYLIQKYVYLQDISLIDFYGTILASNLLNDPSVLGRHFNQVFLHDQIKYINEGSKPYPIYTALATKQPYEWIEFTPFEVGSDYLGGYIPSWSLGRRFFKGVSEGFSDNGNELYAPPLPLGYLMGIWGSALSVNFKELWENVAENIRGGFLGSLAGPILQETTIGGVRIFPAQLYNFTYGYHGLPRSQQKRLTLVDAGIDFNLPMPPLLHKQRDIDMIIVLDASGEAQVGQELQKTAEYFRKRDIKFPNIDYNDIHTKVCNVFYNEADAEAPALIYLPLIANEAYKPEFTRDCLSDYCSTFNFEYTPEQFDVLSGLTEFNMKQSKDCIVGLMKRIIQKKQKFHAEKIAQYKKILLQKKAAKLLGDNPS